VDAKDVKFGADSSAENDAAAADERLGTPSVPYTLNVQS
jgi:hypothetical protein